MEKLHEENFYNLGCKNYELNGIKNPFVAFHFTQVADLHLVHQRITCKFIINTIEGRDIAYTQNEFIKPLTK